MCPLHTDVLLAIIIIQVLFESFIQNIVYMCYYVKVVSQSKKIINSIFFFSTLPCLMTEDSLCNTKNFQKCIELVL